MFVDKKVIVVQIFAKNLVKVLALTLVILVFAGNAAVSAALYPEPVGNINDYVGVLTQEDKSNLNALVDLVLNQQGVTFAVAIVDDHGDESIEIYGANLYEKWGIGEKAEDKGLLVIISMKEKDVRMEVGYGLEPIITDGRAGESLDKMIPYFAQGDYGKGLYVGLLNAAEYVADASETEFKPEEGAPVTIDDRKSFPLYILILPLLLFGLLVNRLSRRNRCPKCGAKLVATDKIIKQATSLSSGLAVRTYVCNVCNYRNDKTYKINPISRPPGSGSSSSGPRPFFGGFGGTRGGGLGSSGPKGFGGGRSGGGGASRKW